MLEENANLPALIPHEVQTLVTQMRTRSSAGKDRAQAKDVDELIELRRKSQEWGAIDRLEVDLKDAPPPPFRYNHIITPVHDHPELSLYTREIFMPKDTLLTSAIHLYEHPFTISRGRVAVWDNEHGWKVYAAGGSDVTLPGTRRVLFILEDTIWTTQHVMPSGLTPDEVRDLITFDHLKLGHLAEIPAERHHLTS